MKYTAILSAAVLNCVCLTKFPQQQTQWNEATALPTLTRLLSKRQYKNSSNQAVMARTMKRAGVHGTWYAAQRLANVVVYSFVVCASLDGTVHDNERNKVARATMRKKEKEGGEGAGMEYSVRSATRGVTITHKRQVRCSGGHTNNIMQVAITSINLYSIPLCYDT